MCTCIVSLRSVCYAAGVWKYASGERLISVQTDEQTEIDMETNMAVNMGDKSVYIRAFRPREISQLTSLRISKVTDVAESRYREA
jgi:hypothetical protein